MPRNFPDPHIDNSSSQKELNKLNAYWRSANYLSVGQIYLLNNPLLREPLKLEHIKPRLLGHWGTTPGVNFIYAHMNRVIRNFDLNVLFMLGPGHGAPALIANTYLEGTYSEFYPHITQDIKGMQRLFKQFSFPGGIPSHAAPETPGGRGRGFSPLFFLQGSGDTLFCMREWLEKRQEIKNRITNGSNLHRI